MEKRKIILKKKKTKNNPKNNAVRFSHGDLRRCFNNELYFGISKHYYYRVFLICQAYKSSFEV